MLADIPQAMNHRSRACAVGCMIQRLVGSSIRRSRDRSGERDVMQSSHTAREEPSKRLRPTLKRKQNALTCCAELASQSTAVMKGCDRRLRPRRRHSERPTYVPSSAVRSPLSSAASGDSQPVQARQPFRLAQSSAMSISGSASSIRRLALSEKQGIFCAPNSKT